MTKAMTAGAGDLVDLFDEGGLVSAVVTGEEKGRLKVVTETGKEMRVTLSRVAHRAGGASMGRAADAAQEHGRAARSRAAEIDLPSLWEVLVEDPQRMSLADLAELGLAEDTPVARSAMLRALLADRTWFTRKGDDFEPRSREHVEQAVKREAAVKARAALRAEFLDAARGALQQEASGPGHAMEGAFGRLHRETIADLVEAALLGDEAESRRGAVSILDEAGVPEGPTQERAFRLLEALGLFRPDENLSIHRYRLRTSFPPEVEEAAASDAARPVDPACRRDLTDLVAFTIDDDLTTELDDALSVEVTGGAWRIGIHIADPSHFIPIGGLVDTEALSRAATFYFPDLKLSMLPRPLAESAASLVAGDVRPALSFLVTVSSIGEVIDSEIVPSIIRSRARLTYDDADRLIARPAGDEGDAAAGEAIAAALRRLRLLAEALEAERVSAGAVTIRAAEVDIRVGPDGEVSVRRIDERGPSRRFVSEAMILANRIAATFCMQRGIPAIYRRQAPPGEAGPGAGSGGAPGREDDGAYDPVAVRALRRRMRRGEVGLQPAPHAGLGLDAYTQATSPIRRYQDLVVHRRDQGIARGRAPAIRRGGARADCCDDRGGGEGRARGRTGDGRVLDPQALSAARGRGGGRDRGLGRRAARRSGADRHAVHGDAAVRRRKGGGAASPLHDRIIPAARAKTDTAGGAVVIVIIGGGYAGAATAWALARRGAGGRVVLLEAETQFAVHASGRNAGLLGSLLEEDPAIAEMTLEGARLLDEAVGAGACGLQRRGSVRLVASESAAGAMRDRAASMGIAATIAETASVARDIPLLEGAASPMAVLYPGDAQIDPPRLVAAYLDGARRGGVRVVTGARAGSLTFSCGKLNGVETNAGRFEADWVVDAAGAWAGQLAARLSGDGLADPGLRAFRRHLFVSEPARGIDPVWPYVWDLEHGLYFRVDGDRLTLCPCDEEPHEPGLPEVSRRVADELARKTRAALPALENFGIERTHACLRTFAPDRRYLVGPDPRLPGFFWVAGLEESGATAGAAVGELAADLLLGAALSPGRAEAARAFDPSRFATAAGV